METRLQQRPILLVGMRAPEPLLAAHGRCRLPAHRVAWAPALVTHARFLRTQTRLEGRVPCAGAHTHWILLSCCAGALNLYYMPNEATAKATETEASALVDGAAGLASSQGRLERARVFMRDGKTFGITLVAATLLVIKEGAVASSSDTLFVDLGDVELVKMTDASHEEGA